MSTADAVNTSLAQEVRTPVNPAFVIGRVSSGSEHVSLWRAVVLAVYALIVRMSAPCAWRTRNRSARKLLGFAATEQGSAKDMLRAAWLDDEPARRRLFLVHALDEFRHADLFRAAAKAIAPDLRRDGRSEGALVAAARMQGLFARHDDRDFLAFVEDAEERGLAHFSALSRHFASSTRRAAPTSKTEHLCLEERARLCALFGDIARDEKFHVQYSGRLLARSLDDGSGWKTHAAARIRAFGDAWRRSGRTLGDRFVHLALWCFVISVFPLFALLAWSERGLRARLVESASAHATLDDERRALSQQL
jgi:hypothetical protein